MPRIWSLSYLVCVFLSWSVTAQEGSSGLSQRLEELERQVGELENRLANRVQVHGFLGQGWIHADNNWLGKTEHGSFDFNEFGVSLMTNLNENIHLGLQLVSRRAGPYTTDGLVVDWGYGDYVVDQWLGIRIGRVRTPIGIHNETRDIDALRVPALLPQSFYTEPTRDVVAAADGLALYGNVEVGVFGSFDYLTWFGGLHINPESGMDLAFEDDGLLLFDDISADYTVGGKMAWNTPVHGLLLSGFYDTGRGFEATQRTTAGLTALIPAIPAGTPAVTLMDELQIYGGGFNYDLGRLNLTAEYRYVRGDLATSIANGVARFTKNMDVEGYYGMASYELTDRFAVAATYGVHYPNADDRDGETMAEEWYAWQKDLTLSTRYNFAANWAVKAEIHFIEGVGLLLNSYNPDGFDEHWQSYVLKTSYSF